MPEPPVHPDSKLPSSPHAWPRCGGSCSAQSPSQGPGGSRWDPPGLPGFSREVAGCSDSRWASQTDRRCSAFLPPRVRFKGWGKAS